MDEWRITMGVSDQPWSFVTRLVGVALHVGSHRFGQLTIYAFPFDLAGYIDSS